MKSNFLALLLLPLPAFAGNEFGNGRTVDNGNEHGNGGDYVAQQFISGGRELVARLREHPDSRIPNVNAFEKAVEKVKVTSSRELTLHGAEVDAINFPSDDHIDVNRSRWQEAAADKRAALVLHEYLGILQVSDLHYEISGSYAEAFYVPEPKPRKFSFEAGATINSAGPTNFRWYKRPGAQVMLAYELTPRASLTVRATHETYNVNEPSFSESSAFTTVAAGYKHWLTDQRKLRAYIEGQAGVAIPKTESTWASGLDRFGDTTYSKWEGYDSNYTKLLLGAGGGVRYALSKEFGISGSGYLQNVGLTGKNGSELGLQFNLGLDVVL